MIKLASIPTTAPDDVKEKDIRKETEDLVKQLGDLQERMYAERKHAVLVVLQGMDASGKDGAAHKVFDYCRITGLSYHAFKKPTEEEFAHDFLWRIHKVAPEKGMIGIFNRSHYEDILIQRVHGWIDEKRVEQRMRAINAFEETLVFDNNTHVFKFYMHTSKDEQEKQLLERMQEPEKYWKHNPGDWEERKFWDQYMEAYEYAINNSSIPWYICPVDQRWYRDYFISKTLVEALEKLHMKMPPLQDK
ncbi:MAG: polyphosphate kinase [Saprospiraceae bacterium]|nr:polyphosphate kinase [Saprospiraceae bacterium]MCB0542779.1 polyphosphate kinase [Saprospiraceae bacterium]MCB9354736.1 polyphosphate kinase [Lewinellaceae bacterium]